jgi:hypothetical protein
MNYRRNVSIRYFIIINRAGSCPDTLRTSKANSTQDTEYDTTVVEIAGVCAIAESRALSEGACHLNTISFLDLENKSVALTHSRTHALTHSRTHALVALTHSRTRSCHKTHTHQTKRRLSPLSFMGPLSINAV